MGKKDHEELDVSKSWEWKGYTFEVKYDYRREVGLIDGEVISDVYDGGNVIKKLYDHSKYLESKDETQEDYNCPFCSFEHKNINTWEKHIHKNHYEEISEPWAPIVLEDHKEENPNQKSMEDIDIEQDSVEEVRKIAYHWRNHHCAKNNKHGFTASLLRKHIIHNHPEEVFY